MILALQRLPIAGSARNNAPTMAADIVEGAQFTSAQPDLWENDALVKQDGYMTDLITAESIQFIERNAGGLEADTG